MFKNENVPDEIVKRGRELYYGYVTWLDNEIGKLFKALDESEAADNTVIIYTTDHGENLGEHGMWWKNNMYDTCARIPMIINFPGNYKAGLRVNNVCSMLDLVPAIAEICGAETQKQWDGKSLINLVEGRNADWPNFAISEYYAHNIAAGHCMIRRDKYKYVYFNKISDQYPAEKQLFDLEADPGEFNNLAHDAKYGSLINDLHALMARELGRDPEDIETEIRNSPSSEEDTQHTG
jgi:choline-sulfatase